MAQMPVNTGVFELTHNVPGVGTTTHLLLTENKFLDKNIAIKISTTSVGAASYSWNPSSGTNETTVTVGTVNEGYYPLTSTISLATTFARSGWMESAGISTTASGVAVGRIVQSNVTTTPFAAGITPVATISVTPNATSDTTVYISEGYNTNRYVTISPMSSGTLAAAQVNVSGTLAKPTIADANPTVNGAKGKVTITPATTTASLANKYYIAVSVTATGLTPTVTNTVTTAGYLGPVGANSSLITVNTNSIAGNNNLYYAPLNVGGVTVSGSKAATTPTITTTTATASGTGKQKINVTPTTSNAITTTYYIALLANAPATTNITASSTTITEGYLKTTDTTQVTATFLTTSSTNTYYLPITSGTLASSTGNVSVSSSNVTISTTSTQPSSGFYITALGSGIIKVDTTGWLAQNTTKNSNTATLYGVIPAATFTATNNVVKASAGGYIATDQNVLTIDTGTISTTSAAVSSAALNGYTENTTAIVPSGGTLLLSAGYYGPTKISLATLVPDQATIEAYNVSSTNQMLAGYKAYNSDGTLLTGTIPTYEGDYTYTGL